MTERRDTHVNIDQAVRPFLFLGVIGTVCFLSVIVLAADQGTPWLTLIMLCASAVQSGCGWCAYVKASEARNRGRLS